MKLAIVFVLATTVTAYADDRCATGVELAKQAHDLPRAALYLESCTDDDSVRVRNSVAHKLEDTQLSHVTVISMPEGVEGETTAMPGEKFTTPATIWTKAGTYKITVGGQTVEKVVEPHSRTTVIINVPPPPKPAKNGSVSFEEEPEQHQGTPAAVKHGTMLPKKYLKPSAPTGEQIDDPLPYHTDSTLAWRLGVRATGGITDRTNASLAPSVGLAVLAARPLDGPIMLATRLDYAHRKLDTIGLEVGFAFLALERPSFVLSVTAALRGEVRVESKLDMMDVNRAGIAGAAGLDLAVLSLPLAFGARVEQGFSELMPGVHDRAYLLEVGYDWR